MSSAPNTESLEQLLCHSDWLTALARRLVADASSADDLVQDTWVAALRRPPDPTMPARPWLAAVLRRLSRMRTRRETRTLLRGDAGIDQGEAPGASEVLARIEQERHLAGMVLSLEEPYRSTLLLRFYQGQSAAEISRVQDVPAATIRTRIRRGLEKLRERLEREHGGDHNSWVQALGLVIYGGEGTASTASIAASMGGLIMGKTGLITGLAVSLGLILWLTLDSSRLWTAQGNDGFPGENSELSEVSRGQVTESTDVLDIREEPIADQLTDGGSRIGIQSEDDVEVIVIDKESNEPVASASVSFLDLSQAVYEEVILVAQNLRPEGVVEYRGLRFQADSEGRAVVPRPSGWGVVIVDHDGYWGMSYVYQSTEQQVPVELAIDRRLSVQVVDSSGEPRLGVPVALKRQNPNGSRSNFWVQPTESPDGLVAFPHLGYKLDDLRNETWSIGLAIPLPRDEVQPIRLSRLPDQPIRLILPETGSLVVSVEDSDGQPYVANANVRLGQSEVKVRGVFGRSSRVRWGPAVAIEHGKARFPYVALGLELEVEITSGDEAKPVLGHCRGPTYPGEIAKAHFSFGESLPVLIGRVLRGDDLAPVGNTSISPSLRIEEGGNTRTGGMKAFRTDEDGRFRYPMPTDWAPTQTRTLVIKAHPDHEAEINLSYDLPAGETDLGDVILREVPMLASGMVVDGVGRPVERASVRLEAWRQLDGEQSPRWVSAPRTGARTKEDGTFEIYGLADSSELRAIARCEGYTNPKPIDFVAGSDGVRIVMTAGAVVAGSLLLDPTVPPSHIRVSLHYDGEGEQDAHDRLDALERLVRSGAGRTAVQEDGGFEWTELVPGKVTVEVGLVGGDSLLIIRDVEIKTGEATRDSRLLGIDLRGQLTHIVLSFVDRGGKPIDVVDVAPLDYTTELKVAIFRSTEGKVSLVSTERSHDLFVYAPGYLTAELRNVRDDQEVLLDGGFPIRIHVPDHIVLPEPPLLLSVVLVPSVDGSEGTYARFYQRGQYVAGGPLPFWKLVGSFRESRDTELIASIEGEYRVHWSIARIYPGGGGSSVGVHIPRAKPVQLSAALTEALTTEIPRGNYDRALKKISE